MGAVQQLLPIPSHKGNMDYNTLTVGEGLKLTELLLTELTLGLSELTGASV